MFLFIINIIIVIIPANIQKNQQYNYAVSNTQCTLYTNERNQII